MSGLEIPIIGQEKTFRVQHNDAPLIFPVSQLLPTGGGAVLSIWGGLSKFEYFLGQCLANPAYSGVEPADILGRVESVCNALQERNQSQENES
jgi:hypothetical protein